MRFNNFLFLILSSFLFIACTSVGGIVTTFSTTESKISPGKYTFITPPERSSDGEYLAYQRKVSKHLKDLGFQEKTINSDNNYLVIISYGQGQTSNYNYNSPIYGQTGGGSTYQSGTFNTNSTSGSYSGTSYSQPKWGQVGSINIPVSRTPREFMINFIDAKNSEIILTKKVNSSGRCDILSEVIDEMLQGLFENFYQTKSRKFSVPAEANC